jgi:aspartate aminotransferase-like enzyme
VGKSPDGLRFLQELLLAVLAEALEKRFQRHRSANDGVARLVHAASCAASEIFENFVPAGL